MFGGMDDCVWALWPERCSLAHGDEAMKNMTCSTDDGVSGCSR